MMIYRTYMFEQGGERIKGTFRDRWYGNTSVVFLSLSRARLCDTRVLGNANCRRSGLKQFSLSSCRHRYHVECTGESYRVIFRRL